VIDFKKMHGENLKLHIWLYLNVFRKEVYCNSTS